MFVVFNRFMVHVGFAAALGATYIKRMENFNIKKYFVEPGLPNSVGFEI